MTPKEKQLLRRALIAYWQMMKSEHLTEAIEHIDEIVDAVSDLTAEDGKK